MSLFHYQEWFDAFFPDCRTITTGIFFDDRSQIIVGTLNGLLGALDPGKDVENRQETASLIEQQLANPIIQVEVGNFLTNFNGPVIAVLHPKELHFYSLVRDANDMYRFDKIFQHRIKGQPAYNMCIGNYGKSEKPRICVQTINCTLHFFESENHILTREAFHQIHPGPIAYHPVTDSVITTSGGVINAVKFTTMASMPSNKKDYKTMMEWDLNIGDTAVAVEAIVPSEENPVQPSLAVLCRRSLHCLTSSGSIRYTLRLENPAMAMYIQIRNATIHYILATHVKTLLFYQDTTMIWAAQLNFIPISVSLATFGDGYKAMITLLSDEFRCSVGYLGTEPSFFRMPVTDSRFIDFEARQKELAGYEEEIATNTKNSSSTDPDNAEIKISFEVHMDSQSNAIDTDEPVPSATLKVIAIGSYSVLDIFIDNLLSIVQIGQGPTPDETDPTKNIYMYTMFAEKPIYDHRMTVIALADSRDTVYYHLKVPLKLICEKSAAQKSATFKFSLDSTEIGLEMDKLFPEFESENQASIGLRPYYSQDTVSIFVSQKSNRYRIQSDNLNFCYVIIEELCARIKKFQPNAKIKISTLPIQVFIKNINDFLEAEKRFEIEEANVRRLTIQMRHVEMVLLQKLKSENETPPSHVNVLVNFTYRDLLMAFDRMQALEEKVAHSGKRSLRSQLNLFTLLLEMYEIELPFDGRILDGTFQKLGDRISFLLPTSILTGSTTPEPAEVCRMIVNYCERGGKLTEIAIAEEDEGEEEGAGEEAEGNAAEEFLSLKSGTVPVRLE
uniref:PTHB1 N-terminal domain-containing protein n=1 Tax=Panagrolaimus sp. ES5 TaxID=591445 RepID=A0AC34FI07_9BILA